MQVQTIPADHPAVEKLRDELGEIEMEVMTSFTLADAIRLGSKASGQAQTWEDEQGNICAMSAGVVAAKALGYIE